MYFHLKSVNLMNVLLRSDCQVFPEQQYNMLHTNLVGKAWQILQIAWHGSRHACSTMHAAPCMQHHACIQDPMTSMYHQQGHAYVEQDGGHAFGV